MNYFSSAAVDPYRVCGTTLTTDINGCRDERGHLVAYVHLREHGAAWKTLGEIHALHAPNPEGIVPWCPTCRCPAPCETRRLTTAAMPVQP
ncbi:MAG: hypothetical protein QM582_10130 [Micropruina sp.]|uniref:hypothetical protein n=1 Tax=Micropruina sp. TaxID=2737536 RepID=UPI0039E53102